MLQNHIRSKRWFWSSRQRSSIPAMPDARRANLPLAWASPAFDRLQLEDYDWLTGGADANRRRGYEKIDDRLGYPPENRTISLASYCCPTRLINGG